eukprot:366276-Chlamydomonas_euryale.AAC.9
MHVGMRMCVCACVHAHVCVALVDEAGRVHRPAIFVDRRVLWRRRRLWLLGLCGVGVCLLGAACVALGAGLGRRLGPRLWCGLGSRLGPSLLGRWAVHVAVVVVTHHKVVQVLLLLAGHGCRRGAWYVRPKCTYEERLRRCSYCQCWRCCRCCCYAACFYCPSAAELGAAAAVAAAAALAPAAAAGAATACATRVASAAGAGDDAEAKRKAPMSGTSADRSGSWSWDVSGRLSRAQTQHAPACTRQRLCAPTAQALRHQAPARTVGSVATFQTAVHTVSAASPHQRCSSPRRAKRRPALPRKRGTEGVARATRPRAQQPWRRLLGGRVTGRGPDPHASPHERVPEAQGRSHLGARPEPCPDHRRRRAAAAAAHWPAGSYDGGGGADPEQVVRSSKKRERGMAAARALNGELAGKRGGGDAAHMRARAHRLCCGGAP